MVYHKVFGIGKITHHENNGDITVVFNFDNKPLEWVFVSNLDRITKSKRYIKELDYIKYEGNKKH